MPELHDADVLFKALADPTRRKLLDLLHAHDGRTLNDLCEHLDMTRQGVTQHLNLLEMANLVAQQRTYRTLERLCAAIADRLLERYDLGAVWVKAAKPEPPMALPVSEVSVEVWREAE